MKIHISKGNIIFIGIIILVYLLLDYLIWSGSGYVVNMIIFQIIFIAIAISPVGEGILRFLFGVKSLKTSKDKEFLMPLFESVYESVKEKENYSSENIKLYIDESMHVNAYAMGRRTIAITRGAVETLSAEEIKGVFAHEFGHIVRRRYLSSVSLNSW